MFVGHLVIIAALVAPISSLQCFLADPEINYFGIVSNEEWRVCTFLPAGPSENLSMYADGMKNENGDLDDIIRLLNAKLPTGLETTALCLNDIGNAGKMSFEEFRCYCMENKCNEFSNWPKYTRKDVKNTPHVVNASISYQEYKGLMKSRSMQIQKEKLTQ